MEQSNTVAQQEAPTMSTTIRVLEDLWIRVKVAAAQHGITAQQLCAEGLELRLAQLEREKGKA